MTDAPPYDLFPKQPELTDAIFKVFNDHRDALLGIFSPDESMFGMTLDAKKPQLSRADKSQYVDPSNLVKFMVSEWLSIDEPTRKSHEIEMRPIFRGLEMAFRAEKQRNAAPFDGQPVVDMNDKNIVTFLRTEPAVWNAVTNQNQLG